MLKKKLILIVSIILLFSLCLVGVSATNSSLTNSTDPYSNPQSSNLCLNNGSDITIDYSAKLNSKDESQIILNDGGDGGSFSDLQKLIDSNTNGTINLDKDYKYAENDNLPDGLQLMVKL